MPFPLDPATARRIVLNPQAHLAIQQAAWADLKAARGQPVHFENLHPCHIRAASPAPAAPPAAYVHPPRPARVQPGDTAGKARVVNAVLRALRPGAPTPTGGDAA